MFKFFRRKKQPDQSKVKRSKDELREIKWEKLQRRILRWCVIRQYTIILSLKESKSLYEVKKLYDSWNFVKSRLRDVNDFCIDTRDLDIIRRFIQIKQKNGHCDYENIPDITLEDYLNLPEPDYEMPLLSAYANYEIYWDNVLMSYKRPSYKISRLKDLICTLKNNLNEPMTNYPAVQDRITALIEKYDNNLKLLT